MLQTRIQGLLIAVSLFLALLFTSNLADRMIWVPLGLGVFVLLAPNPMGSLYALRAFFVLGLGYLWLQPHLGTTLSLQIHGRNLAAFFFLGLGTWSILERSQRRLQLPTLIFLPLMVVLGLWRYQQRLGSVTGSWGDTLMLVMVIFVALGVVALLRRSWLAPMALLPFVSAFVVFLLAKGHFLYGFNPWHMIFLCAPFLAMWIRDWFPLPRKVGPEIAALAVASGLLMYVLLGPLLR